jgi:thymidylate synthase (FAD)
VKIINASYEVIYAPTDVLERIELAARTCYKSEDDIAPGTASKMVHMLRDRGHFAMFDHVSASVRFVVDRGVSHELVRHRIAAYAQESTRYCNYSKGKFGGELTFISPCFWGRGSFMRDTWVEAMLNCESLYLTMVHNGASPQEARSVLPNSLKTEIVATLDFTAWRHVFRLRTSKAAHPQMREVMVPLLADFTQRWPEVFNDIKAE